MILRKSGEGNNNLENRKANSNSKYKSMLFLEVDKVDKTTPIFNFKKGKIQINLGLLKGK